ncbi:hypothetical protein FGIG_08654 [Fasciola gigantica]|uniref:Uncharacterized protein n=1 Tax=Fasciola gigantica TaxID=46835 RepID=A0A504ZEG7_FASGI|nr:hypothetical protein FGIG_08654 [Fasciola gigantica]
MCIRDKGRQEQQPSVGQPKNTSTPQLEWDPTLKCDLPNTCFYSMDQARCTPLHETISITTKQSNDMHFNTQQQHVKVVHNARNDSIAVHDRQLLAENEKQQRETQFTDSGLPETPWSGIPLFTGSDKTGPASPLADLVSPCISSQAGPQTLPSPLTSLSAASPPLQRKQQQQQHRGIQNLPPPPQTSEGSFLVLSKPVDGRVVQLRRAEADNKLDRQARLSIIRETPDDQPPLILPHRRWTSVSRGSGSLPSSLGIAGPVESPSNATNLREFRGETETEHEIHKPSKQCLLTKLLRWKKTTLLKFRGKRDTECVHDQGNELRVNHTSVKSTSTNRQTSQKPSDLTNRQCQSGMPAVGAHPRHSDVNTCLDRDRYSWKRRSLFESSRNQVPELPDTMWRTQSDESLARAVCVADGLMTTGDFSGRFQVNFHNNIDARLERGSRDRRRISFGFAGLIRRKKPDMEN